MRRSSLFACCVSVWLPLLSGCDERQSAPSGSSAPESETSAVIERGTALRLEGERAIVLAAGDPVLPGQTIESLTVAITLRWPEGGRLHLGAGSRFVLAPTDGRPGSVLGRLASGTVRAGHGGPPLTILTARGSVRLAAGEVASDPASSAPAEASPTAQASPTAP